MKSKLAGLGLGATMLLSLMAMSAGTAFAATDVTSPGKVQSDTTKLHWNHVQGTPVEQKCGSAADPGHLGYENGATADNYMLWIFNHKGIDQTSVVITINGTDYTDTNDGHQIVTPFIDPATITDAYTNFTVNDGGGWNAVLTISHGCGGGEQDQKIMPAASLGGPCADPAYYAVFDNSASNVAIKFRFSWYNTNGYNVVSKVVPGGSIYTTFQHWAKPGTVLKIGYKDPNTGAWTNLVKQTSESGSFPACDFTPGWSTPTPV